ncbi:Gamma-glutamyl hydrolase A [Hondaea fermentalgiana]|uniref:Gamma-glutamyl hydrolase A n=1 Tax=Hondaea fermentalgiana TaxID=2315210 RepID=A0A2R5GJE7_9STRA|nr:Gamma-glutamyl hydrolase A [Hondaea fermentalgiana]|eukprot:GBG30439.1 Gamma-glutamyl hydrolase A [Hondaea fermentalgiana]
MAGARGIAAVLAAAVLVASGMLETVEARGLRFASLDVRKQAESLGASACEVVNDRPIIGVLSQPAEEGAGEYVAASYVKVRWTRMSWDESNT